MWQKILPLTGRQLVLLLTCGVGLLVMILIAINAYVLSVATPLVVSERSELTQADAVLILGAGVRADGELGIILRDRVNTAVGVYRDGYADKILMSGDNGQIAYDEVTPVLQYLLAAGIPAEDIFLDYAGFNTYDSVYRAYAVFKVDRLIVVTQPFHIDRAVFIADRLGLEVHGYPTNITQVYLRNHVREFLARANSAFEVWRLRSPRFLGEAIPITGVGRATH
jgi:vancomycin permeability regulator SanA